jgi:hypothetical protein
MSKQKGICPICSKSLFHNMDLTPMKPGNIDIDLMTAISEGGSKTALTNLRIVHRWCHQEIHNNPK